MLTGLAYAPAIFAFAATRENDSGFAMLFRFGIVPMFLFSGTFFPVSQLPDGCEPVAWAVPLWHGVDLCRDARPRARLPPARPWYTCGYLSPVGRRRLRRWRGRRSSGGW